MSDLLGSFSEPARVRPKCAGKTCVGVWGWFAVCMSSPRRSEGPGCYKWYQSNLGTVADCAFSAPSGGKHLEITVQRECCIPKWG